MNATVTALLWHLCFLSCDLRMLPAIGLQALVLRVFFILFLERQLDPENVFDKPQMFMFKNGAKRTYTVTSFNNVHLTLGNSFWLSTSTSSDTVLIITVTPVSECEEPSWTFTRTSLLESSWQSLQIQVIPLSPIYRGRNGGLDILEPCTPDPIAQQPRHSATFLLTKVNADRLYFGSFHWPPGISGL